MPRYNEDGSYTRLGRIYHNMKTRCNNPNYDKYKYYGGKGVTICDEWNESFYAFEDWAMDHGYADRLTLDRIDVNGNYTPENCRLVTRKEQSNNKTSNHMITYNGKTQSIQKWADETGLSATCINQRVGAGWSVERTLTEPQHITHKPRLLTYNGVTKRMHEWAKEFGISFKILQNRIDLHGWTVERALETPVYRRCFH